VSVLSKYFYEAFASAVPDPGARCVVITDAGTPLETQARTWKVRRSFVHGAGTGIEVGGRFSAFTYFGLVPASLIGLDVGRLLARAEEMSQRCGPLVPLQDNPAVQLGAVLGALAQTERDKMSLVCPPDLTGVGAWIEQLVAESTGKMGKGIVPLFGEALGDPASSAADRVFVELQLADRVDQAIERHVDALAEAGHPVVRIRWQDRYDLGGEVIRWSIATSVAGGVLGINPFDEPNVQESKDRTKALLGQFTAMGRLPSEPPIASAGPLAFYGASPASGAGSAAQLLADWLRQIRPGNYLAVLSFLPRSAVLDRAVETLRHRLAARTGCAAMIGFGPRYLHSTGQLFKGGPDTGLFLLLTAEDGVELPIPGEPFSFSVLKQAQALGDFQAMQQKGRRILRVHLSGNLEQAAEQLLAAIDDSLTTVAGH
jgi:hypothetical protein